MDKKLIDKLQSFGVIPVIAVESVDTARSLARALIAGGLPVAEITFRTAARYRPNHPCRCRASRRRKSHHGFTRAAW